MRGTPVLTGRIINYGLADAPAFLTASVGLPVEGESGSVESSFKQVGRTDIAADGSFTITLPAREMLADASGGIRGLLRGACLRNVTAAAAGSHAAGILFELRDSADRPVLVLHFDDPWNERAEAEKPWSEWNDGNDLVIERPVTRGCPAQETEGALLVDLEFRHVWNSTALWDEEANSAGRKPD